VTVLLNKSENCVTFGAFFMAMKNPYDQLQSSFLTHCGLNMQAVLPMNGLPESVRQQVAGLLDEPLQAGGNMGCLVLLGNGGRDFWDNLPEHPEGQQHPLDAHAITCAETWVKEQWPGARYQVLYPSSHPVGLQQLGKLAGWHGDSPLKLGINPVFGLWYAYRALLWLEIDLPATSVPVFESPCLQCTERPCVSACPAGALEGPAKSLQPCVDYRLAPDSPCQFNCLARNRCPVAAEHRYGAAQLAYHYRQSYNTLLQWRA